MSKRHIFVLALCASLLAAGAEAAEESAVGLDYVLRVGGTYSDNIFRRPEPFDEGSGAIAIGGELRGERPTGRFRYETALELTHYEYLDSSAGNETFGRGLLSGSYDFVPDQFRWNASVNFDQLRGDPLRPIAPGNVEDVITLSTGPTVQGELFGAVDTQLDAHYIRSIYTGETFDNDTVGGRLELGRRIGPRSRYGLGGSLDAVTYQSGPVSSIFDFQRTEAFLYGELVGARTEFSGEFGYTQADGDSFDGDGPLVRVRLTRRMSLALTGYVGYRREFPTSGVQGNVSDPTPGGGGVINTSLVTSSPRESRTGELGFRYQRTRSEGEIGFYRLEEKSLILALGEHTYDELRARVTRQLTPRSRGSVYASYSKEDFSALARNFDELTTGLQYSHDFTRSIGLDARIEYRNRESNDSLFIYDELAGGVFLRYTGSMLGRNAATSLNDQIR